MRMATKARAMMGTDDDGELVSVSPAMGLWGEDWEARFGDG